MSEIIHTAILQLHDLLKELQRQIYVHDDAYHKLLSRYDDAQKRMHDMQAELEYLRSEQGREH